MFNSAYVVSRAATGNKTIEKLEANLAAKMQEAQALRNTLARLHWVTAPIGTPIKAGC
jgi:hypothetical protein